MKRMCIWLMLMVPAVLRAEYTVPLYEDYSGNRYLRAEVDGTRVLFTFDSGCSGVTVSRSVFEEMLSRGVVTEDDLLREEEAVLANGEYHAMHTFVIKRLRLGDCTLHNIPASVGLNDNKDAPSLLGQTVLERFRSYTVAGNRFRFQPKPEEEQQALFTADVLREDTTTAARQQIIEVLAPLVRHLSPRYLVLYANALDHLQAYDRSIDIYERLFEQEAYLDMDAQLAELFRLLSIYYAREENDELAERYRRLYEKAK